MQAEDKNAVHNQKALEYHKASPAGKVRIQATKPLNNQADLSLAYSPGVAEPCKRIAQNPEDAYEYTNKGNLVAVISNGTAVLGLGNIGALASKPVMEGKAVLFKKFAGVDAFDIELDSSDPEFFIQAVRAISGSFGGINLEDIKAPECFQIEDRLKQITDVPVMHDDQHGTAIISGSALLNALEITNRNMADVKIVVLGAGAAAIACAKFYFELGIQPQNLVMFNSKGAITKKDYHPDDYRYMFATDRDINSYEDAFEGADVVLGLARGGLIKPEYLKLMAPRPIVMALSNPDPEIDYDLAMKTRSDLIMATGRSDYPNQVNNVLGFPYIFRGALDVRAKAITEGMKMAAAKAIAALAKEPIPQVVKDAYQLPQMAYGPEYLIPKPLDNRLITYVATAVAKAAVADGVARKPITDWDAYQKGLIKLIG